MRINVRGQIGVDYVASDFQNALEEADGAAVDIWVQSEGGDVFDGLSMANAIANYPGETTVTIDSFAASIATVFPMAADNVVAHENATLMIHRAWTVAVGNAGDMRMTAEILDKLDKTLAKMYAAKAGKGWNYFLGKMSDETVYTAEEARKEGLIDRIAGKGKRKHNLAAVALVSADDPRWESIQTQSAPRPNLAYQKTLLNRVKMRIN